MSRLVPYAGGPPTAILFASGRTPPTPSRDRIEALAKFVPAEILAFYVPIVPAISLLRNPDWIPWFHWLAFLLAWILVPIYFIWVAEGDRRRVRQALVSTLAFPIWAYVTNRTIGPLAPWYEDALGVIVMLLFSLATAFLLPRRPE